MRRDFLHKSSELIVDPAEKKPALRGIEVGRNRQINQVRPRLSEIEIGLLGYVNVIESAFTEEIIAYLQFGACNAYCVIECGAIPERAELLKASSWFGSSGR
jgi:hypothetical protein